MSTTDATEGGDATSLDVLFDCLESSRRRRLLGYGRARAPDSVECEELAAVLAAGNDDPERVTDDDRRRARRDLRHVHLPKLEAAGLLEQEPDGTVAVTDHPAYEDAGIREVLGDDADVDAASRDALFGALADARRRTALDVLSHQFSPVHVETLAREMGAREQDVAESELSAEAVQEILVGLHHVHLPHLREAGLVEYDEDAETVTYEGHPDLRVPWMHSVLEPDFPASLTGESEAEDIGTVEGREQVVSFGQSLCDRADEELFCMFTETDLLEAGCLTRVRDASRRGADVYLGTRDPTVREYVRENAPEVTLWEPETNWLNLPVAGNRVGRLLLADREAIMLGTLHEGTDDESHREEAIIGEGEDNTLVVMVAQLLDPYLEQLDDETDALETSLPL